MTLEEIIAENFHPDWNEKEMIEKEIKEKAIEIEKAIITHREDGFTIDWYYKESSNASCTNKSVT